MPARMNLPVVVQFPFWWREYIGLLVFLHLLGFEIDTQRAARFIARHSKITIGGLYA